MEEAKSVDTCPICYDAYGDSDISITKCGHKFHTSCFVEAMKSTKGSSCPLCRTNTGLIKPEKEKKQISDLWSLFDALEPFDALEEMVTRFRETNIENICNEYDEYFDMRVLEMERKVEEEMARQTMDEREIEQQIAEQEIIDNIKKNKNNKYK